MQGKDRKSVILQLTNFIYGIIDIQTYVKMFLIFICERQHKIKYDFNLVSLEQFLISTR